MKIYFVKQGETLFDISRKHGVTMKELLAANPAIVNQDELQAATKIVIPDVKKTCSNEPLPAPQSTQPALPPLKPIPIPALPVQSQSTVQPCPYQAMIPAQYSPYPPKQSAWYPQPYHQSGMQPGQMPLMPVYPQNAYMQPGYGWQQGLQPGFDAPYNTPFGAQNYLNPNAGMPSDQGIGHGGQPLRTGEATASSLAQGVMPSFKPPHAALRTEREAIEAEDEDGEAQLAHTKHTGAVSQRKKEKKSVKTAQVTLKEQILRMQKKRRSNR